MSIFKFKFVKSKSNKLITIICNRITLTFYSVYNCVQCLNFQNVSSIGIFCNRNTPKYQSNFVTSIFYKIIKYIMSCIIQCCTQSSTFS